MFDEEKMNDSAGEEKAEPQAGGEEKAEPAAEEKKAEPAAEEKKAEPAAPAGVAAPQDRKRRQRPGGGQRGQRGSGPRGRAGARGGARGGAEGQENEFIEKVVKIGRVSKVVKGGKNFSFNALVITGDGKGKVGIGFGKSNEVVGAITKGTSDSKKSFKNINMSGDTIPHEVLGRFKSSRVLLKPAGPGTGVIAGGPVRAMCDAAGIKNILTKSMGSRNPVNVVKAVMDGFMQLRLKRRG
jgi:small subunit ribosomal protein S5